MEIRATLNECTLVLTKDEVLRLEAVLGRLSSANGASLLSGWYDDIADVLEQDMLECTISEATEEYDDQLR